MSLFLIKNTKELLLYFPEYFRFWKIAFLLIGILFLILGSFFAQMADWDVNISMIMAILTYFFSPLSGTILLSFYFKNVNQNFLKSMFLILAALILWIISVDTSYVVYSKYMNHIYYRGTNFLASSMLYFICALILSWRGEVYYLIKIMKKTNIN
jgi:hypothetical protein